MSASSRSPQLPRTRASSAAAPFGALAVAARLQRGELSAIDVREPLEYAGGHIEGSRNVPLSQLQRTPLPAGPLLLVCQSGQRSARGGQALLGRGHAHPVADLEGGLSTWQPAGLPLRRAARAPLPLMRQVQIGTGALVLLGLLLSTLVAPAWLLLTWGVGAGLLFAGLSGFCGMARLLARMPWNRIQPG